MPRPELSPIHRAKERRQKRRDPALIRSRFMKIGTGRGGLLTRSCR
jgi:hypothetical protein